MDVRPAGRADADQVAEVHVRSWQAGYKGLLPDDHLAGLRPEERARRYRFDDPDPSQPKTFVAVDGEVILGFVTTGPSTNHEDERTGEVFALYVDPPHWRRGVGRALISDARRRLCEQGFGEAVLWVLAGNERADRFYRLDGWGPDGSRRRAEVWGIRVDELRYRRPLNEDRGETT
jgi:ribosomal protein S18 acetylase RimI-like enzyme